MPEPDAFHPDVSKITRFGEPAKFLPVIFVWVNVVILWSVYTTYHCIPLLSEPATEQKGIVQTIAFNAAAVMLSICYVRCLLTHPGTIPGREEGALAWEVKAPDSPPIADLPDGDAPNVLSQETKRSGDRRHCKWCDKYKPDRCHHCRVCRTCILRMDHHCPWIYNCVGFCNHKYFFLLLLYSAIACHLIVWTMYGTLKTSMDTTTPFLKMFWVLFGETLAAFLGIMVTLFFGFHIWLMLKAMTTIEFCEKSMKRVGYDSSAYDRGVFGNMRAVLGDHPILWLCPCSPPSGDGMVFVSEEAPLLRMTVGREDMEAGRGIRKKTHESGVARKHKPKKSSAAGSGEQVSGGSEQDSDSSAYEAKRDRSPARMTP